MRSTTGMSLRSSTCSTGFGSSRSRSICSLRLRSHRTVQHAQWSLVPRLRARDPVGVAQMVRRPEPGRRRRIHPARMMRAGRLHDRDHKPGRACPAHSRHLGPIRVHGRATRVPAREEARPRHGILGQDTRTHHGRPTGTNRQCTTGTD